MSITNLALAQNTPEEMTGNFFNIFEKSPDKAIEYIFGTNKYLTENLENIKNLQIQLQDFIGQVGAYHRYEKITEKSVGANLKLVSFRLRYDRQPMRITLIFYRPLDKWTLFNFKYDDSLDDELKEAAKAYRLRDVWD
ncbi:MAG: hypothetical protein ACFB10_06495 [Salibacteraceae bacterium]